MKAWYDDIDAATLQRIKAYSAFNDTKSKNLMMQTMYEYREKEIQDFKETNHELAETCIARKKRIAELEKENAELADNYYKMEQKFYDKLTEAKEILKKYLSIGVGGKITQNYLDVTKQAEQFLKESENK